jgi:serine phosphatase RsbU (regulator of sigma subunit)
MLVEASYALHTTLELDKLLGLILHAAAEGVSADRGTVFLLTEDRKELWSKVLTGDENLEIRLPVGKGIAGAVAKTGETIRLADAHKDPRFDASWDLKSGFRTKQMLAAPIRGRDGKVVGVFQLLNKKQGDFDEEDEGFLAALSVHAALAVENARLHKSALEKERQDQQIHLVQTVQRAIQPERNETHVDSIEVAGMNELCEDASGDYYDFIELADGRLALAVGDVSGHGLGPALVMAQARAFLRAFCRMMDNLPAAMNLMNDYLARDMTQGRFMSMVVVVVDPKSGTIEWVNCGHPPPMLLRAKSGEIEELEGRGRVLGILPGANYEASPRVELRRGDVVLLYTDGATEAQDPKDDFFGVPRLQDVVRKASKGAPSGILEAIRASLLAWTKNPNMRDDLTLVALKRDGAAKPTAFDPGRS